MKVVIEKDDANTVNFEPNKEYLVLKNYKHDDVLGTAKVFLENGIMCADIAFRKEAKGFPAIGFTKHKKVNVNVLDVIAICDSPNVDESIERIEYALQLEGKPSNLKTK